MYPHSAQPYDKYGGPVPVTVPPPGAPVTPVQHHQQYPPYPGPGANMGSGSFSSHPDAVSRWSTGLCHCCDDPANCMITCLCPCITFGQIAEIIDKGNPNCACSGTVYALLGLTGFACLYSCFYRSKMRAQYDLKEAPFADCLVHFCCETCALCQEYRELKNRGFDMGIGWDENMNRQRRMATTPPGVVGGMMR